MMKRTLSFVLALLMVLAMFATVSAAEEPEATVEPAVVGTTEPAVEPAEEQPAAPVEEAPASPEASEAAEPTEEPAPEATETVTEPTPAAPEADDGIALTAVEPAATPSVELAVTSGSTTIEVPAAVECWKVWRNSPHGSDWRGKTDGYVELTATVNDVPNAYLTWSVSSDDGHEGNLFNTMMDGKNFYLFGGSDMMNCKESCQYTVTVIAKYGEAKAEQTITFTYTAPTPTPTPAPTPVPARTVTLDANPGYFLAKELTDKSYVTFLPEGAGAYDTTTIKVALSDGDKLPSDLPNPVQTGASENADNELKDETQWTFDGWYTQKPTVTKVKAEGGWKYQATPNGSKVDKGGAVSDGVTALYAYWKPDETLEKTTIVTYTLDYNGFDGKTGALVCERSSESTFTVGDFIIYGFNFDSTEVEKKLDAAKEEKAKKTIIEEYWNSHEFNGYTFTGWYTDRTGGTKLEYGMKPENGKTYYARWTKDGSYTPQPTPAPAGPIDHMHIDAPHLTIHQDPSNTKSVTIPLFVTPVGGTGTITWTVAVPHTVDLKDLSTAFKGETQTYTIVGSKITKAEGTTEDPKFTANAEGEGLNLTIFPQKDCPQVLYVSAACGDEVKTPQPATVVITHTPEEQETVTHAATCTAEGEAAILCAECGTATEVHTIPATGHTYEVVSKVGSVNGARILKEQCEVCQAEETVLCGDVNDDGDVSIVDLYAIYSYVLGETNDMTKLLASDVNLDGATNIVDLYKVYSYVLGEVPSL